jgi:hypothetical protein
MAVKCVTVAPEYCGFYVAGSRNADVPISDQVVGIMATRECINIPCLYWNEGDTNICVGPYDELMEKTPPAFDGMLATPNASVLLFDANIPKIMVVAVSALETRVRIWTNHPTQGDLIRIGLG